MNNFGKGLAWTVAVLSLVAIFLTAKTYNVRKKWMQHAQNNEKRIQDNEQAIREKTRKLEEKRQALVLAMLEWDRYWNDREAALAPDGNLRLALGTVDGVRPDQVLYVFALSSDGKASKYLGDFKVTRASETELGAVPNWFAHAGQILPGQYKVRVRTMIPNPYQTRLAGLDQQLLAVQQIVTSNQAELEREAELLKQTEDLIAQRLSEINGNDAFKEKNVPNFMVKGLLAAIAEEEEARNAALVEADQRARELKTTREQIANVLDENKRLTESLPRPVSEPTVGAAGR